MATQARNVMHGRGFQGARPKPGGLGLRPIPVLDIGDTVNHDTFGTGTVVELIGEGDKSQAVIDFGAGYGEKRLVLRFAPVAKVG